MFKMAPSGTSDFTLALAQINPIVGDIKGNAQRIVDYAEKAAKQGADLVLFPEMCLVGYPPEDLVLTQAFRTRAMEAVEALAQQTAHLPCGLLIGSVWHDGVRTYNASILLERGFIDVVRCKHDLPNYGVFDEKRVFASGALPKVLNWRGRNLGILICEEVWDTTLPLVLKQQGAEILLVQNASPFSVGKAAQRKEVVHAAARETRLPVVYLNMVGGQDELVFDGSSYLHHPDGQDVVVLPAFEEALYCVHCKKTPQGFRAQHQQVSAALSEMETIYLALVLGLKDYVEKNGFKGVVIGLSGGIDSGLTAAIAVDALGSERVMGVLMPSPYTSVESIEDAELLAKTLAIKTYNIPITQGMQVMENVLGHIFQSALRAQQNILHRKKDVAYADTTEENIQARLRGNILMAISNKLGLMVLTTGNKSEMSVGYATLYGDMCGGYSVLKDVYKTTVYQLSVFRNQAGFVSQSIRGVKGAIIPQRMITKAPSAELKPNQTDQDTLPPYDVLDTILRGLIEQRKSIAELVREGLEEAMVRKMAHMLAAAEYKRRQSCPGVKITAMAFGRDRRYPITNRWTFE